MFGKNEDEHLGVIDRARDAVGVHRSGHHVARGDPTQEPMFLEGADDGIGDGRILRGVADEGID